MYNTCKKTHKAWDWRQLGAKSERKNTRLLWYACNFERENTTFPWTGFSKPFKNALKYQLDSGTACHRLQHISTESHTDVQNMQKNIQNIHLRPLWAKVNRKTRDFYDACPFVNEKTWHSHKRLSENKIACKHQFASATACDPMHRILCCSSI